MRIRSSLLRASNPKAWGETVLDTRQTTGAVDTTEAELLIVGAGICGLIAAREMARAGVPCILLDKGSRPGGRAATRPLDGELADYGAQYLELRNEATRPLLREWVDRGIVRPWGMRFPGEDAVTPLPGAFAGDAPSVSVSKHMVPGGMNQLPASLAEGLDLRLRKEVCRLKPEAEHWEVATRDNERFHARRLLLTCPIPQALRLLESSGIAVAASALELLGSIRYEPCFSMLAKLDGPSGVPCPGGMFVNAGPVAWIADNHQKGVSPGAVLISVEATREFSEKHFEDPPERVAALLIAAVTKHLGAAVVAHHLHRWRYARPRYPLSVRSMQVQDSPSLMLAGDAFGGRDIESAILSGLAASEQLLAGATPRI